MNRKSHFLLFLLILSLFLVIGIIGHARIMVSLSKAHYTNQGIKQSKVH